MAIAIPALSPRSDLEALQRLWRATWRDAYGPLLGPHRMVLVDQAVAEPAVWTMFAADGSGFNPPA